LARKPNYRFQRNERERLKDKKKADRAAAKTAAQEKTADEQEPDIEGDATPDTEPRR